MLRNSLACLSMRTCIYSTLLYFSRVAKWSRHGLRLQEYNYVELATLDEGREKKSYMECLKV
jgi:hypothetical protein